MCEATNYDDPGLDRSFDVDGDQTDAARTDDETPPESEAYSTEQIMETASSVYVQNEYSSIMATVIQHYLTTMSLCMAGGTCWCPSKALCSMEIQRQVFSGSIWPPSLRTTTSSCTWNFVTEAFCCVFALVKPCYNVARYLIGNLVKGLDHPDQTKQVE